MFRTMTSRVMLLVLAIMMTTVVVIDASGAVPQLINYQGRLTDATGGPLDTTMALIFQIYADSNGVTSLWDETHPSVTITDGLFQVLLGSVSPMGQDVFTGEKRWLGVRLSGGPATALIPIVSTAYAYRSNVTDTAALAKTVSDNAITSAKIQNGAISLADIGQNSATAGEVIKWNGSAWEAQADATASNTSGWTDGGTVVGLTTPTDTVAINTTARLGKLNLNGDIGMSGTSSIYFGSDANRITATGNDMRLVAEDLSVLITEDFTFGEYGVESWIKFDNANRGIGIGTLSPDERLQVENDASGGRAFLQLETSHAANFGETGIRFKTPQNTWHLRMDDYTNNNLQDGALGLRSQVGVEAMTWLESGNVGIGTTNPTRKLHVYGSAQIKDTVYAGAINPSLMAASRLPDEAGVAGSSGRGNKYLTGDWLVLDSLTIDVPASGNVLALATTSFYVNHSYGKAGYITFGISTSNTEGPSVYYRWSYDDASSSGTLDNPANCHRLFTASSAGEHRYYFMVRGEYLEEDVRAEEPVLTAVYFPTSSYYGIGKGTTSEPQVEPRASDAGNRTQLQLSGSTEQSDVVSEFRALRERMELLEKKLEETKK